jgi:CheY-like chemotaxis protein
MSSDDNDQGHPAVSNDLMSRALIADDEPTQRASLRATLEELGFIVEEAADGLELSEHFRAAREQGVQFAVVVTDVQMPRRNGLDALDTIRAVSQVPAVVVTGAPIDARKRVAALGSAVLVGKPYDLTDLIAALGAVGFTAIVGGNLRIRLAIAHDVAI